MALEVRPCAPEELLPAVAPIWHYFGREPSHESVPWLQRLLPAERMHAAHDSGAGIVGGAGVLPFTMTVPGARVATAGVTVVGVLPTHRRRGILRAMMRKQLDDVHERGEARMIDTAEALEALPPLYDSVAAETPGMVGRSADWWELRTLDDAEWRRHGAGELTRVLLELDGEPAAYALYRLKTAWEDGSSTGSVNVVEAVGATPAATRAIWRFLLDIDWMQGVNASLLPVDHPLLLLVPEPQRLRFRLEDGLWIRLVDVGAALSARTYAGEGSVVLTVTDAFCPWNDGVWRVEDGEARRCFDEPELALDVEVLGSVYLGGFGFSQLARAGRVVERVPGALERADALFASEPAPWCPEIF